MFFVGVQLDITAHPPPKAAVDLQSAPAGIAAASRGPADAAAVGAGQQTGVPRLSAASQQVCVLCCASHSNMHSCMCLLSADLDVTHLLVYLLFAYVAVQVKCQASAVLKLLNVITIICHIRTLLYCKNSR